MILEGAMIVIATSVLTFFHPGLSFAGYWAAANFGLKGRKKQAAKLAGEKEPVDEESNNADV